MCDGLLVLEIPRLALTAAALFARPVATDRSTNLSFFDALLLFLLLGPPPRPDEALACSLRRSAMISSGRQRNKTCNRNKTQ